MKCLTAKVLHFYSQHYKILGIPPNSSLQQVKAAYYKQAQMYHPDKNPGKNTNERFAQINLAYSEITNRFKNGHNPETEQHTQQYSTSASYGGAGTRGASSSSTNGTTGSNNNSNSNFNKTWYYQYTAREAYAKQQQQAREEQEYYQQQQTGKKSKSYTDFFSKMYEEFVRQSEQAAHHRRAQKAARRSSKDKKKHRTVQEEEEVEQEEEQEEETNKKSSGNLDIHIRIELKNEELEKGCTKQFTIRKSVACECSKKKNEVCRACKGSGVVYDTISGYGRVQEVCHKCYGEGTSKSSCKMCRGKGVIYANFTQKITIPKGTAPNSQLFFDGRGKTDGKKTGKLIVRIAQALKCKRNGDHVQSEEEISVAEAVLGTRIKVQTLYGSRDLDVPKGIKDGDTLSIAGFGYEKGRSGNFGDHIVKIRIKMPQELSKREQQLYAELLNLQRKTSH